MNVSRSSEDVYEFSDEEVAFTFLRKLPKTPSSLGAFHELVDLDKLVGHRERGQQQNSISSECGEMTFLFFGSPSSSAIGATCGVLCSYLPHLWSVSSVSRGKNGIGKFASLSSR